MLQRLSSLHTSHSKDPSLQVCFPCSPWGLRFAQTSQPRVQAFSQWPSVQHPPGGTHPWPPPLYLPEHLLRDQAGTNGADVSGEDGILKVQPLAQAQGSQVLEILVVKFLHALEVSRRSCGLPALLWHRSGAGGEHHSPFLWGECIRSATGVCGITHPPPTRTVEQQLAKLRAATVTKSLLAGNAWGKSSRQIPTGLS